VHAQPVVVVLVPWAFQSALRTCLMTWSRDRRAVPGGTAARPGLMDLRTGAVHELGRLGCGYLHSAWWTG
jgi:hypothetical protein